MISLNIYYIIMKNHSKKVTIMKVLILLAKGFEMMEFSVFIDVMGWARNDYGKDIETITLDPLELMSLMNRL